MASISITQDRENIGRALEAALRHIVLEPLVRGKLAAIRPDTRVRRFVYCDYMAD